MPTGGEHLFIPTLLFINIHSPRSIHSHTFDFIDHSLHTFDIPTVTFHFCWPHSHLHFHFWRKNFDLHFHIYISICWRPFSAHSTFIDYSCSIIRFHIRPLGGHGWPGWRLPGGPAHFRPHPISPDTFHLHLHSFDFDDHFHSIGIYSHHSLHSFPFWPQVTLLNRWAHIYPWPPFPEVTVGRNLFIIYSWPMTLGPMTDRLTLHFYTTPLAIHLTIDLTLLTSDWNEKSQLAS